MDQVEHEDRLAIAVDCLTETVSRLNTIQARKSYWPHAFAFQLIIMASAFTWQQFYFANKIEARRLQSLDFLETMEAIESDVKAIKVEMSDYMTTHFYRMGPEHQDRHLEGLMKVIKARKAKEKQNATQ